MKKLQKSFALPQINLKSHLLNQVPVISTDQMYVSGLYETLFSLAFRTRCDISHAGLNYKLPPGKTVTYRGWGRIVMKEECKFVIGSGAFGSCDPSYIRFINSGIHSSAQSIQF